MRSGFYQRAAVAIFLMGALLAPFGMCLQPAPGAAHRCCQHARQKGNTAKQDCCIVRSETPAAIVAPAPTGSAPVVIERAFFAAGEISSPREVPAAALVPTHAPPGRTSILRI
jgi:hypothetical protein